VINWEAIGALAELAGAVAVVATLFYLADQLKQNTNATKAQIHQSRSDQAQAFFLFTAGSREIAEIVAKVNNDPENLFALEDAERVQFRMWSVAGYQHMHNMYFQMKTGFLSPELYKNQEQVTSRLIPLWEALGLLKDNSEFNRELERIRCETTDR